MTYSVRFSKYLAAVAVGCMFAVSARLNAQASTANAPQTKLQRFASHFDLGISASGEFATNVNGTVQNSVTTSNGPLAIRSSNTVGVLATIRGQKSPWVGGEFNFRQAKYDQSYTYANNAALNFRAQNTVDEFTAGYLARPDHPFAAFQPFVGAGAGTIEFKPTRGSATGLPVQARAAYYYTVGGDRLLYSDVLGIRIGFRELFYLAPDFGQNYLRIKKLQSSLEPTIGFYIHF